MARTTTRKRKLQPKLPPVEKPREVAHLNQSVEQRSTRGSSIRKRPEWLLLAGILIVTFLAYSNALNGEFLYDDQVQVLRNPTIKSLSNLPRVFTQSVWQFLNEASDQPLGPYYRPVFNATLIINFQLFGLKVLGWHLTSVLLHLIATALVYFLARSWTLGHMVAGASALLFGLHPIHSESVAWVSALPDVLAGVFTLCCLLSYELHRQSRRRNLLALSWVFALLAMLSKEVAIVIPLFLLLRELLEDRPSEATYSSAIRSAARRTAGFVVISVVYFAIRYWVLGFISKPVPNAAGITASEVFLTVPSIMFRYARLSLLPFPLAVVYDDRYVTTAADVRFWGAALVVTAIALLTFFFVRFSRSGQRAVVLSILSILPVLNLKAFNHDESLAHDRYLYLASIGFCVLAALALTWVSARFGNRRRVVFVISTASLALVLFGLTAYQNRSWRNFITLMTHASTVAPEKSFIYYNLGSAYDGQGQQREAEENYRRAIQYKPSHTEAHINLAVLLTGQSLYDEALEHLMVAQNLAPSQPVMLYALGNVYMRTNRHREAIGVYEQLARIRPSHKMVYTNLGLCYETLGEPQQARAYFQKAIEVAPAEDWTNVARKHLAKLED